MSKDDIKKIYELASQRIRVDATEDSYNSRENHILFPGHEEKIITDISSELANLLGAPKTGLNTAKVRVVIIKRPGDIYEANFPNSIINVKFSIVPEKATNEKNQNLPLYNKIISYKNPNGKEVKTENTIYVPTNISLFIEKEYNKVDINKDSSTDSYYHSKLPCNLNINQHQEMIHDILGIADTARHIQAKEYEAPEIKPTITKSNNITEKLFDKTQGYITKIYDSLPGKIFLLAILGVVVSSPLKLISNFAKLYLVGCGIFFVTGQQDKAKDMIVQPYRYLAEKVNNLNCAK